MPELSPAAQAVNSAYMAGGLAAALQAVADQVVPEEELIMNARGSRHWHRQIQRAETRAAFFAIATELRGQSQPSTEEPQ